MRRNLIWLAAGAIFSVAVAGLCGLIFVKSFAHGFSSRSEPSFLETIAAQQARSMAMPVAARSRPNPVAKSKEVLDEGMAHWADHFSICHGNNGNAELSMGQQMYPHSPDMRKPRTQNLTDGELFYIIENGIRLSGMPAFGSPGGDEVASWKLVHFIRHLPDVSPAEVTEMEKLNPKGPEDEAQEKEAEQFLNGKSLQEAPKQHKH